MIRFCQPYNLPKDLEGLLAGKSVHLCPLEGKMPPPLKGCEQDLNSQISRNKTKIKLGKNRAAGGGEMAQLLECRGRRTRVVRTVVEDTPPLTPTRDTTHDRDLPK